MALVPKSISSAKMFWLGRKILLGLTARAGKLPAFWPVTLMPGSLSVPQLPASPLLPEVSGRRAPELRYCQSRNRVVGVSAGAPGMAEAARTKPALGMPRFVGGVVLLSVGPVRSWEAQFKSPLLPAPPAPNMVT